MGVKQSIWFKVAGGIVGTLLVLLLPCGVIIFLANPRIPDAPELAKVSLDIPPEKPTSPELIRLLTDNKASAMLKKLVLLKAKAAIAAGKWVESPGDVLTAMDARKNPSLAQVREALAPPGCLPVEPFGDTSNRYSYFRVIQAAQYEVLRAVALVQLGRGEEALAGLATLQGRILQFQRECTLSVGPWLVTESALIKQLQAVPFMLAGASSEASQAGAWRLLLALEDRPNPLAGVIRREHRWHAALARSLEGEPLSMYYSDTGKSETTEPPPWPWFDLEDLVRLVALQSKRMIWLHGHGPDSPAWTRSYPELTYHARLKEAPHWFTLFRYNGVGKEVFQMPYPPGGDYPLKWHQTRCMAAARRVHWAQQLRKRGRRLSTVALEPAPRNPFSGHPFPTAEVETGACDIPEKLLFHKKAPGRLASEITPLPPDLPSPVVSPPAPPAPQP